MKPMPPITRDDHVRGAEDAPLTIVQYGDYDCPHTRASAAVVQALTAEIGVPVRFVFRHFPLRHMHENAEVLSEIAEAAGTLGHFWQVHDRLMSHPYGIRQKDVVADLASAGIEVHALEPLLGSKPIVDRVEHDVRGGSAAGVHSTPTWFFNGAIWDGHYDLATLLARARLSLGK